MKIILLGLIFFVSYLTTSAQSLPVNKEAIKLVDSATLAFCANDTSKTIAILERIEELYPTDGFIVATNKALAELYVAKGRTKEAIDKLLYALTYKRTSRPAFVSNDICNKLIKPFFYQSARADVCVALSKIYLSEKRFDSTLHYLNFADGEYMPYVTCGVAVVQYRSYLSPFFADCYLAMGDTTKAIKRILDYLTCMNGNTVVLAQKLKPILLQKHSQKEITKEVRRGLKKLNYTMSENDTYYICLPLFDYTIKEYWGSGKPKHYKKFYKRIPGLKTLSES